ncbi:MAG TPA: (E)-4-hydroxy-3-methylbut-2-enyl-diphosphate synthase [Bacteroidia bacterium]|nr:(E)-4-hydroxy-3-methylbut-2-enyl-diphosphate synthase [Bacteroidia bacterium]HNU32287.1 (E)-4-hydroxy-3-methylbut-2-enyl-diphosphate synthase [Bacteroidia bacterium]
MKTATSSLLYCNSLTQYQRMLTREVSIGDLKLGGNNPIRVQSMTTTDTMNTIATVEQSIRMIEAGCELVRITAPSINEAKNLQNIKNELHKRGHHTPIVADIHFTPNAAEVAARIVEKVRVNPGNFADKKKFETIEYTNAEYDAEIERIRTRFIPLVKICKEYGTAMRIGTNHGSLSDRIMSRYGDTPLGMVESALEFLRICEEENYKSIVLSMKSSNPQVMVQAYRLLIVKMKEEGMNYPLHLGVTEAGDGEDGRIKSAAGIGTLLEDGIGDTIRVSLTEDPEFEIPVAKMLAKRYSNRANHQHIPEITNENLLAKANTELDTSENNHTYLFSSYQYQKRKTKEVGNIGGHNVPRVIADLSHLEKINYATLFPVGYNYSVELDKWNISDQACDFIYTGNNHFDFEIPGTLAYIVNYNYWLINEKDRCYPYFLWEEFVAAKKKHRQINFVEVNISDLLNPDNLNLLNELENVTIVLTTQNNHGMAEQRRVFFELMEKGCKVPVIIKRGYAKEDAAHFQLYASTDYGALSIDGFGDGIWLTSNKVNPQIINSTSFGVLQATRQRISKTEYISCPSCGRTLFDLQETTQNIRSRTSHLKGIKIGIMGCIVNGPGEMADADYGYVGSGVGKITLYKGKEVVERSIDSSKAVDALIELIKKHGDWMEKN